MVTAFMLRKKCSQNTIELCYHRRWFGLALAPELSNSSGFWNVMLSKKKKIQVRYQKNI